MTTLFISHSSKDKGWAERMHAALAEGGYQCLFLDSHPDDGIHSGADWEQTLYQRLRQSRGVVVLCSAHWLASPWCVAEAMMARDRGKRVFLLATADVADDRQVKGSEDAAPRIPDFLKDKQFISLSGVTEQVAHQLLLEGLKKEGLKKQDFKLPDRPYPGLEPFQEADAGVFFGRDEEIDKVIDVLHRRRKGDANGFIVVLGASGCGKSSLVRAGVLPRLRRASGDDSAPAAWIITPPFMGGNGLNGLAMSLAYAFKSVGQPQDLTAVRGRLAEARDLGLLAHDLLLLRTRKASSGWLARHAVEGAVLIVIDQVEEVFGTPEGSHARAALRLLIETSADTGSSVAVLATIRSDFLNAFQRFEGAAESYEKVTLDPMPRSRFAEVIEGPADRFGLDLDPGLVERMVEETAQSGALPLLAFTLKKLYEECKAQGRLTLAAYDELGGVDAAIKNIADRILSEWGYAALTRDLRRAFYSLVRVGEEGQLTRRTARWSQMPTSCEAILEHFVDHRLLVSGIDDHGEATLSVAHEALFRGWDTMRCWLLEDRKALALRSEIEDAAAKWQAENRTASHAWSEERLLDAVRRIEASGVVSLDDVALADVVRAFLGPTNPKELETLPALGADEDATGGSGRYGEPWRLPLSHEARASVGVRLALLGDQRAGVRLRADGLPDIDWCRIEGGEVTIEIRSDPFNPNSEIVKTLKRNVAPFHIARYPVTVIQFRAFLQDCQRKGKLELPLGFPFDLNDYQLPTGRARYDNYPVDTVSWYDAAAFCHWLSARFGFLVRLPTEAEWQLATGGSEAAVRSWPWGPSWHPLQEPWRGNTIESELYHSCAVGLYPLGASSTGVLDMAGTVWEWCRNAFNDPDNVGFPINPRDRQARRGGSWADDVESAYCASRAGSGPEFHSGNIGFRPVCTML